ncbi:YncE family protein [Acidithiobacillus sp.]|uniref:YncE family protein n=1 Tax=Acidithiobacillus sp. TaxID=1872118 RepID=UPI003CFFE28E
MATFYITGTIINTLKLGFIIVILIMSHFAYANTQSINNINRIFCLVNNRHHQYKIIMFKVHHPGFLETSLSSRWFEGSPQVISVGKDVRRLYVANAISKTITPFIVIDHTLKEDHPIRLKFSPWCIAPYKNNLFVSSLMGSRIYWLNFSHHKVSIIKTFYMPKAAIDKIQITRFDNCYGLLVNSVINKKLIYIPMFKSENKRAKKNENYWHVSEVNPRYIRITSIAKDSKSGKIRSRTIYVKNAKSVVIRNNGKCVYIMSNLNGMHVYRLINGKDYKQTQNLHYKKIGSNIMLSINHYLFIASNGFNRIYSYKIERSGEVDIVSHKKINSNLYISDIVSRYS